MAGVSTKAIKTRIKSMESTRQITKAMELVAASKLRTVQYKALQVRPYFDELYNAMTGIAASSRQFESPFLAPRKGGKQAWVVIAGDRGLAGGYNNNILKLCASQMSPESCAVLPIGKKAVDYFTRHGYEIITDRYAEASDISIGDSFTMMLMLSDYYLSGRFSSIHLGYTAFVTVLTQTPMTLGLLPLPEIQAEGGPRREILYESDSASVFNAIVPEYLGGLLYGAVCESVASEQAARRAAMDSATKNADEIISNLNLSYNRARQGAITQEITEIVAGAEN